jgi:hypothetical protein
MQTQSAASSAATLPLLAINRKDTGANRLAGTAPTAANPVSKRFQYGGIVACSTPDAGWEPIFPKRSRLNNDLKLDQTIAL